MNYTNYKVVWVDDFSGDNSAYHIHKYLSTTTMKLKSKITIIRNNQHVGSLGSMHLHINRYCGKEDIIVACHGDGTLVGTQSFNILNKVYQNPEYWMTYSRSLNRTKIIDQFNVGSAPPLSAKIEEVRTLGGPWENTSVITFRRKVIDAIPLQSLIEIKSKPESAEVYPRYYTVDSCLVYSSLEVCGRKRMAYISDLLYSSEQSEDRKCG
jgi:hypothetical protein